MKEWVFSVITSVFLFSILGLVLPDNSNSKFIKKLFAILMIFVVISPLDRLKNTDFDFNNFTSVFDEVALPQTDYLDYILSKKITKYETDCMQIVKNLGIDGAKITLKCLTNDNYKITVENVYVNLKNSVINSDKAHINIIEDLVRALSKYLMIDSDRVVINE